MLQMVGKGVTKYVLIFCVIMFFIFYILFLVFDIYCKNQLN